MKRYLHISSTSISTICRQQLSWQVHMIQNNAQLGCQHIIHCFASSKALSYQGDECKVQVLHKRTFKISSQPVLKTTFSPLFLGLNQCFYHSLDKPCLPVFCFLLDLSATLTTSFWVNRYTHSTLYIEILPSIFTLPGMSFLISTTYLNCSSGCHCSWLTSIPTRSVLL